MVIDCDLARNFLSVLSFVIGVAIAGPVAYFIGRNRRARELTYRGPGGGN